MDVQGLRADLQQATRTAELDKSTESWGQASTQEPSLMEGRRESRKPQMRTPAKDAQGSRATDWVRNRHGAEDKLVSLQPSSHCSHESRAVVAKSQA